jgi:hypothetical protein
MAAAPYREMEVVGGNADAAPGRTVSCIDDFLSSLTTLLQYPRIVEGDDLTTTAPVIDPRSAYRRLPVHCTQLKLEGVVARDLSSYFVRVCDDMYILVSQANTIWFGAEMEFR